MDQQTPPFDPVRYGLVGFGRFCRNRLIPAFAQVSGSRIVALCKRDAEQARATAVEFGIRAGYGRLEDLLGDLQVEAVYITSANADHEGQAVAAARAGKHVLCEKPMATSAAACRKIIQACQENGVRLMVAHQLRFSPAVLQVKDWIESRKLGRICLGRALFTYDGTKSPRTWLHDYDMAGGGAVMDIGVHCLDTLRFLVGEAVKIQGILQPQRGASLIESRAAINMQFDSGALGSIFCSFESPYRSRLEVAGDRGWAYLEPFTLPWADVRARLETEDETLDIIVNSGNLCGALIENFSRAVRGLGDVAIPGEEGWRNQELIDEMYQSAA